MDFLDPKKEKRNRLVLLIGYCLVALAIGIATLVLLYQSYGYDINSQGQVTQNGLVFVSSQPSGASIYLNGKLYKSATNTRVTVPEGSYLFKLSKAGYRTWQRAITVRGGDVQHFDYPFLFPITLKSDTVSTLAADPSLVTQSPDRHWLLLGQSEDPGGFVLLNMGDPAKPVSTAFHLPDGSYHRGDANGAQSWSLVAWAADNRHVLLRHNYVVGGTAAREYLLIDRDSPADSQNLTSLLGLSTTQALSLYNNQANQFYVYDSADDSLLRENSDGTVVSRLSRILAFEPYGDKQLLYVTDQSPTGETVAGQVSVVLQDGQRTYTLRTLPTSTGGYTLALSRYSGDWYAAVASPGNGVVYVYKNPQNQTLQPGSDYPAPWRRLSLPDPSYLAFSPSSQFLLAEGGQHFITYDLENIVQYPYVVKQPMDQGQTHASWMDGSRLQLVSGGKLVVFDYDYQNVQTLVDASAAYLPMYAPDYSYLYTMVLESGEWPQPTLLGTPLTVK